MAFMLRFLHTYIALLRFTTLFSGLWPDCIEQYNLFLSEMFNMFPIFETRPDQGTRITLREVRGFFNVSYSPVQGRCRRRGLRLIVIIRRD